MKLTAYGLVALLGLTLPMVGQGPPAATTLDSTEPTVLVVPNGHYDGVTAAVGSRVLFAGGASYGFATVSDVVDIYDARCGSWTVARLSEPRHALAAVTAGSRVFFAGGHDASLRVPRGSSAVDIYDSETGRWSVARLSEPRHYICPVTVAGKVLFAGGWSETAGVRDTVDVLDLRTWSWSVTRLPQATSGQYQAVALGPLALIASHEFVNIYDTRTGQWSTHRMVERRGAVAAARVGSKALFAGGLGDSGGSSTVDVYDAAHNTWQVAQLSQGRFTTPAVVGARAYFFGGWTGSETSAVIDIYDAGTGRWSSDQMPYAAWGIQAVEAAGRLFLFLMPWDRYSLVYERHALHWLGRP